MFDIGFAELCVIFAIALLVLGPDRLPMAMYVFGRWLAKWRRSFNELRDEFERQANADLKQIRQLPPADWRDALDVDALGAPPDAERAGGEDGTAAKPPPPKAAPPSA